MERNPKKANGIRPAEKMIPIVTLKKKNTVTVENQFTMRRAMSEMGIDESRGNVNFRNRIVAIL